MNSTTVSILGVRITPTTVAAALAVITSWIRSGHRGYICVAAVHLIMECQRNPSLKKGVNGANLVVADGMPLVWVSRALGHHTERIYGPLLMEKLCALAQRQQWNIFFLGGSRGQGKALIKKIKQKFPRLSVVGTMDTPRKTLTNKENSLAIQQINMARPHIVFVGLGCPYQEKWMIDNYHQLRANVLIGVGAAFNFLSGAEKQAPLWIQGVGLEWLYRFTQNPRALWHRYTVMNISFVFKITKQLVSAWRLK